MAWLTVDSNNVLGSMVEEAGTYNVQITRADVSKSGRGNQYISIDYQVLDGTYKGAEVRFQNVTWTNDDPEASKKRFNTILVAVGVPDGTDVESIEQCAKGLLGKKLTIDVDWADPNSRGKIYLQVRSYHKLSQDPSKPNGVKRPNAGQTSDKPATGTPLPNDNDDPFANSNDSVDVKDSDLPF
ncbi:hypothetical protein HMPREF9103_02421 [Lentilactobacillus parafarraginis F0439]|uniref:DUF669 domain-containing protein n=1 Tax=Lentilactobacillus parafarraginis F0439 TaxID=797515 RepID=G9ZRR0_9LACO|nr:DUF669 domain-containing protein [Lentilactobacillus parafarraginis]EHL96278.1 hypothetical protein HMPREF9103_02421 [Lentilactobacillus parafarraginis F0439]